MNFKKLFHCSLLVVNLKNEIRKIFKFRFAFKSKNELYFWYTDLTGLKLFFSPPFLLFKSIIKVKK